MPDLLVAIDLQPAFGHPESSWFTPGLEEVAGGVERLLPRFQGRTVFTRFVPPARPFGSWIRYYEKWPFALDPAAAWLWSVDTRFAAHPTISSHTFSKWAPELRALVGDGEVVLTGVSTECCVLMTALAAVDDGVPVRVVADACAAKDRKTHEDALALMATRAPQLRITTLAEELRA
jgi:nicotinamidase-related amidase